MKTLYLLTILMPIQQADLDPPSSSREEVVVIAHPGVPADRLSGQQLQAIFLGKTRYWTGNQKMVPIILSGGPAFEEFLHNYLKKTESSFRRFWIQAAFKGKGIPPLAVPREAVLLAIVARTPGAIGFVGRTTPLRGVKKITIDP